MNAWTKSINYFRSPWTLSKGSIEGSCAADRYREIVEADVVEAVAALQKGDPRSLMMHLFWPPLARSSSLGYQINTHQ